MWEYNQKDELRHYGVLGMKWGVRRAARLERASAASGRDAQDLRKHGYTKEADAVQKVSNKSAEKAKAIRSQIKTKTSSSSLSSSYDNKTDNQAKIKKAVKSKAYNQVMERGKKAVEDNLKFSKDFYARKAKIPGINEVQKRSIADNWADDRRKALRDTDNYRKVANEASKNTYQAVKTLLGKNYKFTNA